VADVELVEPVDPGFQCRPVGDLERDVVEAGMALLELLTLVGVVVVQADQPGLGTKWFSLLSGSLDTSWRVRCQ
jgi:hypothetical protein